TARSPNAFASRCSSGGRTHTTKRPVTGPASQFSAWLRSGGGLLGLLAGAAGRGSGLLHAPADDVGHRVRGGPVAGNFDGGLRGLAVGLDELLNGLAGVAAGAEGFLVGGLRERKSAALGGGGRFEDGRVVLAEIAGLTGELAPELERFALALRHVAH